MAKKIDKTEENITAVEVALSRSELFIEKNQNTIIIVVGVLVVLVLAFFGVRRFYIEPREEEAQSLIYKAEQYFAKDSLNLALNGDGVYPGFLEIIDDYNWTKTSRLANYYAGIIFLEKGEYEEAIPHLRRFKGNDFLVRSMAYAALGDAHLQLDHPEKAIRYYLKAASRNVNDFTTPVFLMKAAQTYEYLGKWEKAIGIYERIQKEHFQTQEGRDAEKHIAHAQAKMR